MRGKRRGLFAEHAGACDVDVGVLVREAACAGVLCLAAPRTGHRMPRAPGSDQNAPFPPRDSDERCWAPMSGSCVKPITDGETRDGQIERNSGSQ
eukprot:3665494-Prymnesium_polylepis.1